MSAALLPLFLLLLIFLLGNWQIVKLLRQIWRNPQGFRSRAWGAALLLNLAYLPAWYGLLSSVSQTPEFNPEYIDYDNFNCYWLLSALAAQTLIAAALIWQHKRGNPKALPRSAAFILTGAATVSLSYHCVEYLYPLLYGWWWEPLLRYAGFHEAKTFDSLHNTQYSFSSLAAYFQTALFCNALGGLWYYLMQPRPSENSQSEAAQP